MAVNLTSAGGAWQTPISDALSYLLSLIHLVLLNYTVSLLWRKYNCNYYSYILNSKVFFLKIVSYQYKIYLSIYDVTKS